MQYSSISSNSVSPTLSHEEDNVKTAKMPSTDPKTRRATQRYVVHLSLYLSCRSQCAGDSARMPLGVEGSVAKNLLARHSSKNTRSLRVYFTFVRDLRTSPTEKAKQQVLGKPCHSGSPASTADWHQVAYAFAAARAIDSPSPSSRSTYAGSISIPLARGHSPAPYKNAEFQRQLLALRPAPTPLPSCGPRLGLRLAHRPDTDMVVRDAALL
ncbi:hypothetical protein LZ30DRAFT_261932 [Colletotrichum cereale]|nr:hypothetical protein LZ30DRAFT_261932 [Colletotrichum cereale]